MKRSLTSINIFVYTVKQEGGFFWCPDNTQPAMMDDRIPKELTTIFVHLGQKPPPKGINDPFIIIIIIIHRSLPWKSSLRNERSEGAEDVRKVDAGTIFSSNSTSSSTTSTAS